MGIKTIITPKKIKKAGFAIMEVSLKDISKIIMEFKDFPYKGYLRKKSKQMSTDSYFYLSRQLANFMMRNLRGPVITQKTSTQNISIFKMSTQNIPNSHIFSTDDIK